MIFSHLTALTATHRFIHDVSDHVRVFESVLFLRALKSSYAFGLMDITYWIS